MEDPQGQALLIKAQQSFEKAYNLREENQDPQLAQSLMSLGTLFFLDKKDNRTAKWYFQLALDEYENVEMHHKTPNALVPLSDIAAAEENIRERHRGRAVLRHDGHRLGRRWLRGQRDTPVTDARGIVEIVMLLGGRVGG